MQSHSQSGRKWRRFNRKYGQHVFIGIIVLVVLGIVFLLMYALTNPGTHPSF